MTVSGLPDPQSAETLAERYGFDVEALDPAFGVVCVDPRKGIHAVRLSRPWAERLAASEDDWSGPFSDPGVHGFGGDPTA